MLQGWADCWSHHQLLAKEVESLDEWQGADLAVVYEGTPMLGDVPIQKSEIRMFPFPKSEMGWAALIPRMMEKSFTDLPKVQVGETLDVNMQQCMYSDPDSASSSFSILLGNAPHLDGQYAVFGKVTKGDETLRRLEELPTRREGIFVMPLERIRILSTYYYGQMLQYLKVVYLMKLLPQFTLVPFLIGNGT
eukprot:Gb_41327 [translate_table: standard]